MCSEHRGLTWTLVLLLTGALCNAWDVKYQPVICAVRGSSVVIPCSFHYPDHMTIQNFMWSHKRSNFYTGPFIVENNSVDNSSKFQYVGDKYQNCSLKIHSVEHSDTGKYFFRFITNGDKWTGQKGSKLIITELKVKKLNRNRTIKEGDFVKLTCNNSCDGHNLSSAFLWFKNGENIMEGPSLHLSNVSSNSSGNYSCSLKSHEGTTSGVININVEYGPKNTAASVTPSMEVDPGSNITISCSSDANPPVENYTWFKIDDNDVKSIGNEPDLEIMAFSLIAGQYFCSATNKHGSQNSSTVTLKVKEYFSYNTRDGIIISAVALTVLLIVLAVVTTFRKLGQKRTRGAEGDSVEDVVYINWPVFDNSQSQQGNRCKTETTEEILYATVDFNIKRESNMQQQMDTCNEDDSVIYSTVCR